MRNLYKLFFVALALFISLDGESQQIAFPGAEGYGRFATGGRDLKFGRVVEVTNLEDDLSNPPKGSLRWAFSQGVDTVYNEVLNINLYVKRPITIVFKVGGVINLKGDLRVDRDKMTVAGQTAPGDGICVAGATLNFSGSNNVIVRYLRSRPGDKLGLETSAFRIENGGNFIIDHCSFSWAIEETTHFSSNKNSTVQWCIISESLYNSIHKKGQRGYATQWGGEYASYHHNLLAHHNSRMPRINGSNKNDIESLVDYRNNVNYNWGSSGAFYGGEWEETKGLGFCHTNVVNNFFIPGPATSSSLKFAIPSYKRSGTMVDGYAGWYFNGNVMKDRDDLTADNWLGVDGSNVGGIANIRSDEQFVQTDGVLENYGAYTQTADVAMLAVLGNAGAIYPVRDAIDTRIVGEAKGEIGIVRYPHTTTDGQITPIKGVGAGLIDTQDNLVPEADQGTKTAWDIYPTTTDAPLDTDHDGMPDDWEIANGLNPSDPSDGNKLVKSGYSCLEVYLNSLVGEIIPLDTVLADKKVHDFVVAQDGSGDFTLINDAIDAVPNDGKRYSIFIKKGTYQEKVFIGNKTQTSTKIISIIGEDVDGVVITWDDYRGKEITYPNQSGTILADGETSATMIVTSPDFYMENVTVKNPSTQAQAEALVQNGDRQVLKNCKILGNQDTHRTKKGRRFFNFRSTFEGGVDFIYAGGTCYFYQCDIVSNRGGYITAPEDVPYTATLTSGKKVRYGFFFKDCDVYAKDESNLNGTYYLGRPWQKESGSIFLNSRIGSHIDPKGWNPNGGNETTAFFAEYQSMKADGSELLDISNRIDWSIQLTTEDVNKHMLLDKIYTTVSFSNKFSPIPMVVAPEPPTNLVLDGKILKWDGVKNALGYIIYADGGLVGYSTTNLFEDTIVYVKAPTYRIRSVGAHGNLSVLNGEHEDFTAESINEAINTPISTVGVNEAEIESAAYVPNIVDGNVLFDKAVDLKVFNFIGQEITQRKGVTSFNLNELNSGIFVFLILEKNKKYAFKISN